MFWKKDKDEKTLRDELAMSLDASLIPTLNDEDVMVKVAKKYNIEFNFNDEISLINFALRYQTIIRYKYADEMLKTREKSLK